MQLGQGAELHGERLDVHDVPVEHVQLGVAHRVQKALQHADTVIVPRRVQQNAAVRKPRLVSDQQRRVDNVIDTGQVVILY